MIDTQQKYINLNIRGEISIIVVQAYSGRKRSLFIIIIYFYLFSSFFFFLEFNLFICMQ